VSESKRYPTDQGVITVHLGQFTWDHAHSIAERLEEAGIVWWYKEPGSISRIWEHGVRLFVDRDRFAEARAIVATVLEDPSR
jgi:extradiol dioxygenase family protein